MKDSTKAYLLCSPLLGVAVELRATGHLPPGIFEFLAQSIFGYVLALVITLIAVAISSVVHKKPIDNYDEAAAHYAASIAAMSLAYMFLHYAWLPAS